MSEHAQIIDAELEELERHFRSIAKKNWAALKALPLFAHIRAEPERVAAAVRRVVIGADAANSKRLISAVEAERDLVMLAENETCAVQVERMLEGLCKFCDDDGFIEDLKSIPMAIRDRVAEEENDDD